MAKILPPEERAKHYNLQRFTGEFQPNTISADTVTFQEGRFGSHTIASIGYILGLAAPLRDLRLPYAEQLINFTGFTPRRNPGRVLDVGCGRGQLEAALIYLGIPFTAIDFSEDAVELTKQTCLKWSGIPSRDEARFAIHQLELKDVGVLRTNFDTVVFSESIEHIPEEDFNIALPYFKLSHARLIIVNKIDFHPIEPDDSGWNHIRRITDEVYDDIAQHGEVIFREKSHLVVQL